MLDILYRPWPWYVAGPVIGLTVPLLLWLGSKPFGLSSNLRHLCAIALPKSKLGFFQYNWRAESWNLTFALGLLLGGFLAGAVFANPNPVALSANAQQSLQQLGVPLEAGLAPQSITGAAALANPARWVLLVLGGILIGFGTRWGSGCTSGHAITGLATLQGKSLVATVSFFLGGIVAANWLLPLFLKVMP